MSRVDPDLVAVRDLPPGVEEPSDEAVARVWQRIAERPVPRARRWPAPRLWLPIAAAAAVLLVVGAGIAALRPHPEARPATVPQFSSDPAKVAQVFTDLTAAARTATPVRLRAGQLFYYRADEITPSPQDGSLRAGLLEQWITPALKTLYHESDGKPEPGGLLAVRRSQESATYPRPAGADTRPWAKIGDLANGPADPATIRRQALEKWKNQSASDNRKIWEELSQPSGIDPVLPIGHRLALYQVLAGLPVSVAESTVGGRRLVVVRLVEGDEAHDLLFDPSTGRFAGRQRAYVGQGTRQDPVFSPTEVPSEPAVDERRIVPADAVDPGVYLRDLNSFAVVEEVGERP
jgi:hypothetical protein